MLMAHVVNSKGNCVELVSEERLTTPLRKTCFSLVFTRAECRNLHQKWQELMKNKTFNLQVLDNETRFVCEVDLKLAPVDVIADTEALLPFIRMMSRPMHIQWPHEFQIHDFDNDFEPPGLKINNRNLPLVYLKAKSIRLFCPTHSLMSGSDDIEESDMIFANIDSFSIAPQADNPISRILIKPDIYHLSQPLLDIPGATVENRQYQIDVKGAGIFTGKWSSILKHRSS